MPPATNKRKVRFQLHPRVFAALGSDLVSNDFVAITELVKNSYDAFADRVDVRFGHDDEAGDYIEILDNGQGMDDETIESVWCVVATPFRANSPLSKKGKQTRRVAGEKGLGRLSVARLGDHLEMLTKARGEACLCVKVAWPTLSTAGNLSKCHVDLSDYDGESPFKQTGTRLRIYDLHAEWNDDRLDELHGHLSRLLSPFSGVDDFAIWLRRNGETDSPIRIESPSFLTHPKYRLKGSLTDDGGLDCRYTYAPMDDGSSGRKATVSVPWQDVREQSRVKTVKALDAPTCGPFTFELRVWDIASEDLDVLVERFQMRKSIIRGAIRAHKGVSVYRDGILVLPKSESTRDWLGLDIRRVSEVGTRLSTSQIIGYVSISAESNPRIKDTSDRERLVDCHEVTVFEEVIRAAVGVLERERQKDRLEKKTAEKKMDHLFGGLTAESLARDISAVAERGGSAAEALPLVAEFGRELEKDRKEIERRFVYYSRLATIGTLAQMLVHEVRNKTTVVGSFLSALANSVVAESVIPALRQKLDRASNAVAGLDRLAETFAPLASRSFGRGRRASILEDRISGSLAMLEPQITQNSVAVRFEPRGSTQVLVDPGELDSVLLNVIDNAVYWLSRVPKEKRHLEIQVQKLKKGDRVKVGIHDSGPGISEEDAERVFWPGVTSKPGGIGMGLTIAGEIVDAYDGKLRLTRPPTDLGGASFEFDLPLHKK